MHPPTVDVRGIAVPAFFYGTAWKEDRTLPLTRLAIAEGFRAIDTANQRKHYFEAAVGEAVATALADGIVARDELFLQTKFTFRPGQDHRLPYDSTAPVDEQVRQSFASSLEHLGVDRLDSYVLHGPSTSVGLADVDWAAWRAMERLHDQGQVRLLGVSNVSASQLALLCAEARVKPAFVQNRCYAVTGWDAHVRAVCRAADVVYQGFSLLTANAQHLRTRAFAELVQRTRRTPAQLVFRAALQMGMIPLTGTASAEHMREDLAAFEFELDPADVAVIEGIA